MNVKALLIALCLPVAAVAQGFAGLGTNAEGFSVPQPRPQFEFPADHGPHTDYRIEWWYLTANLEASDGTPYGLQWTLFRSALAPEAGIGWTAPQLWMGHAAVTTPDQHYVTERLARGGIGQAGVTADPFEAWIDDWALQGDWNTLRMTASGPDFAYDMALTAQGPLIFHGDGRLFGQIRGRAGVLLLFAALLCHRRYPATARGRCCRDRQRMAGPRMVVAALGGKPDRLGLVLALL